MSKGVQAMKDVGVKGSVKICREQKGDLLQKKVLDEIGCDFEYEYFDVGITALEKEGLDFQRDSRFN